MKRFAALCLTVGFIFSCSTPPAQYGGYGPGGKPDWVDGKSGRYNDMTYLTGVGRGPGRAQCESDAYAALAKIFEAHVNQIAQDYQRYFSQASSLGASVREEAISVSQLTNVSTDKIVKGARIVEHWEGEGTHHCLAALERDPAARNLQEEITRLDAEISAYVKRGDGEASPTQKFMAYSNALELLARREVLNADLRIVGSRGSGIPSSVDVMALMEKFQSSRAQIKVGLKITGAKASTVQTCLAEQLTQKGIQVLEDTSDVDMMIQGALKYEKAGYVSGSEMVRADINLRVTDVADSRTLAAFNENIKVGRPNLEQSIQLAMSKLCENSAPSLVQKIRESFKK